MNHIRVIFQKEVIDNLRDRRTLAAALTYPLLGPAMLAGMVIMTSQLIGETAQKPLKLPVSGAEHAPNLIRYLSQHNTQIKTAPKAPRTAVQKGEVEAVLIIPPSFSEELRRGVPASVRLVHDRSNRSAATTIARAQRLLAAYGQQLGAMRLVARGVSPTVGQAVVVEALDVSTPQARSVIFLGVVPMFIILAAFMGGLYIAIDTTAGERERGSLEPLLINPVSRTSFVLGKLAATWIFTVACLSLTVVGFGIAAALIPAKSLDQLGIQLHLGPQSVLSIWVMTIPLTFLAASLQMIVASFCRSFKEAQTYVSFLMLVPVFPGVVLTILPVKERLWMMMIPTVGEQQLILNLLKGRALGPQFVALSSASTLLLSALCVWVVTRLYSGERILAPPSTD